MDEQRERIACFLSQYVEPDGGLTEKLRLPEYQIDAIQLLIRENVMTADEIKLEALERYNVIIPYDYFGREK